MVRKGLRELMAIAVLAVFFELRITGGLLLGELAEWGAGETIGLLCVAAVGSLAVAIPLMCLRRWGVPRRKTIIVAVIVGGTLVFLGWMHGDIEMGHFVSIPGWVAGAVFAACTVTVGLAIAIAD